MKKHLIIFFVLLFVSLILIGFFLVTRSETKVLDSDLEVFASAAIAFRSGNESEFANLQASKASLFGPNLATSFSDYLASLHSKDNQKVYITDILGYDPAETAKEDEGVLAYDPEYVADFGLDKDDLELYKSSFNPNDTEKRVQKDNDGKPYVLAKDFDFSDGAVDLIHYGGSNYVVQSSSVPQSYQALIKSPESRMYLTDSKKIKSGKGYRSDFLYASVSNNTHVLVKVYSSNRTVDKIEVEER